MRELIEKLRKEHLLPGVSVGALLLPAAAVACALTYRIIAPTTDVHGSSDLPVNSLAMYVLVRVKKLLKKQSIYVWQDCPCRPRADTEQTSSLSKSKG